MTYYWYQVDGPPHQEIVSAVEAIAALDGDRVERLRRYIETYEAGVNSTLDQLVNGSNRIPVNVIAAIVDAYVPKVARSKIHVMHLPVVSSEGGWYSAHRLAEERGNFVEGVMYDSGFRQLALKLAYDMALVGTCVVKVYHDGSKICLERGLAEEYFVDPKEARYGAPMQLFQAREVDLEWLRAKFPQHADEVQQSSPLYSPLGLPLFSFGDVGTLAKPCVVYEAWRVAVGDIPGRHVICTSGVTLIDEEWRYDKFPVVFASFLPSARGFWGRGLVERLEPYQDNIQELMTLVLENTRIHASPPTLVEKGSLDDRELTDGVGRIVHYRGSPPRRMVESILPPEVYRLVELLSTKAFAEVGVSELGAHGEIPRGMSDASGVALRQLTGIETGRHILDGYAWEALHVDVADRILMVAKMLAEENPDFYVNYVGQRNGTWFAKRMNWVDDPDSGVVLRAFPVSYLPEEPAQKLALLSELESRGFVTHEDAVANLELPGTNELIRQGTAGRSGIAKIIEDMVEHGIYTAPEPFFPHELAMKMMSNAYMLALTDNVPEERLSLIRQYIQQTKDLVVPVGGQPDMQPPEPPGPAEPSEVVA